MLKSKPFLEKFLLLIVTAGVSGLLIPVITAEIAHRNLQEQMIFEADLARQTKIIEAQAELLNNLSELLWEYQLMMIDVAFYHQFKERQDLYDASATRYDEEASGLLGRIRAEISKALRLTSKDTYDGLKKLYYNELIEMDSRLVGLVQGRQEDWDQFLEYAVYSLGDNVDGVLNNLAGELKLKGRGVESP